MMDNSVRRFTAIHIGIVLLMLLMGAMKPQLCYSEVPKTVNYQGYLTDSGGIPVDGDVDMEFSIYNVSSGGSSLWSESQTVTVQSGIYSVILGETNPINLTFDVPYYLAVKVGSDAEMTPRQPLTSVGYSFRAADADLLDGQDGSYYRNASNLDAGTILSARLSLTDADVPDDITVDETNIASSIARVSEIMFEVLANDGSGSTLDTDFLDGQDGSYYLDWGNLSNVPVGFADGVDDNSGGDITAVNAGNGLTGGGDTDGVTLHVGAGTGISIFADTIALNTTYTDTSYVNENQGNSISSSMVQIPLSLSGSSSGAIISGDNTNTASGYGVWGEGDYGVYGKAVDSSGAGVYGQNFVDLGYNYGYLGGNTYAVYGTYGTSGPYGYIGGSNYGVYAEHRANGHWARLGTPWEGVYASATGSAYGVRGVSESGQGVRGDGGSGYGVYGTGSTYDFYAGGSGTNYGPFTGGHEVKLSDNFPEDIKPGMIVSVTGKTQIRQCEDGTVSISSTLPTVKLSKLAYDKAVLGAFVKEVSLSKEHWYHPNEVERFGTVNALGEGRAWVSNINGAIQAGDYITTSSIPGYAQRQDDDLLHSYTVAKAIETVDWASVTESVEFNGQTFKIYLIGVVYTSG